MQEKKILQSAAESVSRVAEAKASVAASVDTTKLRPHVTSLSKPGSPSSAMKKAGVALIVGTPDPITAVPGVALIAASYMSKKNDPAKLADLALETRKILRDLQSLSI
ncbi:MAG: hypothetical protein JRM99_04095 [Nitrososphaerota archaeon]|nr:hypothetical protein [Nitrososphaerota archaeon]MDG6990584.1 hypothetical protein [Nitrososphaerota archaeon]